MMLRPSLGREAEAAVDAVIREGYRTPDIAGANGGTVVDTAMMGTLVAKQNFRSSVE